MLSLTDYNNKTNLERERSYDDVFKKQGNEFNKQHDDMKFRVLQNESSLFHNIPREKATKKQSSYMNNFEGFRSAFDDPGLGVSNHTLDKKESLTEQNTRLFNNPTNKPPSDQYINDYITTSGAEIDKTRGLLATSIEVLGNPDIETLQKTFNSGLSNYETTNTQLLGNTNNYIINGQSVDKNKNVYVNRLFTGKETTNKGLFNDDPNNPSMTLLNGDYDYTTCSDMAFNLGKPYFGLQQTNEATGKAKCALGDETDNYAKYGTYQPSCVKASDGNVYGGGWTNAIYAIDENGTTSTYMGCYKDDQDRAMSSTGEIDENNYTGVYKPVFIAGNFGCSPWGSSDYIDSTAQWIWYTENAAYDAPTNNTAPVLFVYPFNYNCNGASSCNNTTAKIFGMADDYCTMKVNGSSVDTGGRSMAIAGGWGGNGDTGFTVTINPGKNVIEVNALNGGGPAGFLLSFIDVNTNELLFNTNGNWFYSTVVTSYSPPMTQSYSVETCKQYAQQFGHELFAVQDILNGDPNTAQCFVSDDLSKATRYGPRGGSTIIGGNEYGVSNVNSVYELNEKGDISLMGKIGHINENNELSPYPSSMVVPGTTYDRLQNFDSPGNDITKVDSTTVENCMNVCNTDNKCGGFIFANESGTCWTKTTDMYGPSKLTAALYPIPNYDLYMREPELANLNSSCPVAVNNITSVDWNAYNLTGNDMTPDSLCKLGEVNASALNARNDSQQTLSGASSKIYDQLTSFMNLNTNMNTQMDVDKDIMDKNLSMYKSINKKYKNAVNNDNGNINNILTNSQVSVLQSNYSYIMWIILALLTLTFFIYVIRKLSIAPK